MLSCAEFLTEFGEYLDESADPQLRTRLEAHLHECKTCQVILDSTRKTIQFVTENDSFTLPGQRRRAHRRPGDGSHPHQE